MSKTAESIQGQKQILFDENRFSQNLKNLYTYIKEYMLSHPDYVYSSNEKPKIRSQIYTYDSFKKNKKSWLLDSSKIMSDYRGKDVEMFFMEVKDKKYQNQSLTLPDNIKFDSIKMNALEAGICKIFYEQNPASLKVIFNKATTIYSINPVSRECKTIVKNESFFKIDSKGNVLFLLPGMKTPLYLSLKTWHCLYESSLQPFFAKIVGISPKLGFLCMQVPYMVNIENKKLKNCTNAKELIYQITNYRVGDSVAKLPLKLALNLASCMAYINPKMETKLYQYTRSHILADIEMWKHWDLFGNLNYDTSVVSTFLFNQIMDFSSKQFIKINDTSKNNIHQYLVDYLRLCKQSNTQINLGIQSYSRLIAEHDILVKALNQKAIANAPSIKTNDKFKLLSSSDDLDVELIDDGRRLVEEGITLKHCVASYYEKITTGNCAIYSVMDKKTHLRYTAEIKVGTKGFYLNQLQGFKNSPPPDSLIYAINNQLIEKNQSI